MSRTGWEGLALVSLRGALPQDSRTRIRQLGCRLAALARDSHAIPGFSKQNARSGKVNRGLSN